MKYFIAIYDDILHNKNYNRQRVILVGQGYNHKKSHCVTTEETNINEKDYHGRTQLHCAIEYKSTDVVKTLIDKGANINEKDPDGHTPLHYAIKCKNTDVVKILIDKGANINEKDDNGYTPLHYAVIYDGNIDVVKTLIDKGANTSEKCCSGQTPLHCAAIDGNIDVVKILIDKGADINEKDCNGLVPLHHVAIYNNHTDIVRALIDKGADPNEKKDNGLAPLHYATMGGCTDIIMALVDEGANINEKGDNGWTPLHYAAIDGSTDIVEILIDKGADPNEKNYNGWTPLHYAVKYENTNVVETLIDKGANINEKNSNSHTPLYLAVSEHNTRMTKLLMRSGADPLLKNGNIENLKHLIEFMKNDSVECSGEEEQQKEKQVDDEYESLKYSLLSSRNNYFTRVMKRDAFSNSIHELSADVSGLTESQKKLNKELLSILRDFPACDVTKLEQFLNKSNEDLRFILNLQRGRSKLTVLHIISSTTGLVIEGSMNLVVRKCMDLLLTAGADPNIPDSKGQTPLHYATYSNCCKTVSLLFNKGAYNKPDQQGKTPLDVAIDNHNYSIEECFLTHEQKTVKKDLENILRSSSTLLHGYFHELEQFLEKYKETEDLKEVLNLHDREGKSLIFQETRGACYYGKDHFKEVEKLLLQAGAIHHTGLDRKKGKRHSLKLGTLWNNLTSDQQEELEMFLGMVDMAKNMNELELVVTKAIDSGIRFNLFKQGKLYNKQYENKYSFADYVIRKTNELKKNSKVVSDIEVASGIVCKLVSKGAVLYNIGSIFVIDKLEEFESHKSNMKKAYMNYENNTEKFMKIAEGAISGKIKGIKLDNSTFCLKCSKDSTVKVAEIIDGARNLKFSQESVKYRRDIIKIGKSAVEIITEDGVRNYTDLADGSDIVLTFHTSLGELEVRLYPDKQDLIKVEVKDQEKWKKLKNCEEEIGQNCLLGGYSVYDAIEQGYFKKYEALHQPSEKITLPNEEKKNNWCEIVTSSGQTTSRTVG